MPTGAADAGRIVVDTSLDHRTTAQLLEDARVGLSAPQKWIPPMHLYDEAGSQLFDAICDTPEYYPTRTEAALLEQVAVDVMSHVRPTHLVELGSGAARKTRILLEAMREVAGDGVYVPMDVSESILRESAEALLRDYPWLRIHGLVGDYSETLSHMPPGERRLVAYLGGTIGNYEDDDTVAFLRRIREALHPHDALLLGADLVKDRQVLHAAYNDAAGITAAFNKNILQVLNRELDADFDPEAFEHRAFFDEERSRIEMHLRALRPQKVRVGQLGMEVRFAAGETLHTEISRKFTREQLEGLLARGGFNLRDWYTPDNGWFSLSVSEPD